MDKLFDESILIGSGYTARETLRYNRKLEHLWMPVLCVFFFFLMVFNRVCNECIYDCVVSEYKCMSGE